MEEIQEMEQQAHNIQLVHLDQMNKQEEKHHANITKLNQENADLRTRAEKREKEWL
jgi:cell division protein FtsB